LRTLSNGKSPALLEGITPLKKIGIFGGSFNPPHIGHLLIAERVCEEFSLDLLMFVPAHIPPHKIGDTHIAPDIHRVNMLNEAIRNNPLFMVSIIEIDRKGVSYTAKTLEEIKTNHPNDELYFLLGSDSLAEFDTWKNPDVICALAQLICVRREHASEFNIQPEYAARIQYAHTPVIEISSTEIRNRIEHGKPIHYYVTCEVAAYIEKNNLYKE